MRKGQTMTRRGVTVKDLGHHETRNGIAWSAEVVVLGMRFRVENDGNGGCDSWDRIDAAAHMQDGLREACAFIAPIARTEPALAEYADILENDAEAAGMFVSAMLDGAFRVVQA